MEPKAGDRLKYDDAIQVLEGMWQHKKEAGSLKSDEMFYELLLGYHRKVRSSQAEGKPLVALGTGVPIEIFNALDIVPFHLWWGSNMLVGALKIFEQAFNVAKSYGYASEVCSSHRALVGVHSSHWIPRPDAVIWASHACDNCTSVGQFVQHNWQIPAFFLDRPHGGTGEDIAYYAEELKDMLAFLEAHFHKRVDGDKLVETLHYSQQVHNLELEVHTLRKAKPSPSFNRRLIQFHMINRLYCGTPQGVAFVRQVRDEMKEAVDTRQGLPPKENFRLIELSLYPTHNRKLVEWMQLEWGGVFVTDPLHSHWGPWEADFSHPVESLAAEYYAEPVSRTMYGPVDNAIEAVLADAADSQADGAIWWACRTCTERCGMMRMINDALKEKFDISPLVLDGDAYDPTLVSDDELKDRIEAYLESIQSRR